MRKGVAILAGLIITDELPRDGFAVLKLDERRIGTLARVDDGMPLAANEARMRDEQLGLLGPGRDSPRGDAALRP